MDQTVGGRSFYTLTFMLKPGLTLKNAAFVITLFKRFFSVLLIQAFNSRHKS